MEALFTLVIVGVMIFGVLSLIYRYIIAPIIYVFSPTMERRARVLGLNSEEKVESSTVGGPSVWSTTSYMISLEFEDGTLGDFSCSRAMYNRLSSGDDIIAKTKGKALRDAVFARSALGAR